MLRFLVHRVLASIPTLLVVSLVVFGLQKLLPGDIAQYIAGEEADRLGQLPLVALHPRQVRQAAGIATDLDAVHDEDHHEQGENAADDGAGAAQKADAKVAIAPPPSPVKLAEAVPLPPEKKSVAALRPSISRNPFGHDALVARAKAAILASASQSKAGFFEKLFGKTESPALAYASADASEVGEVRDNAFAPSDDDRYTAVYDISAKVVYMPDGSKLEAHSGLGAKLDDPRSANIKMEGVTPPHIYDLKLRESLFHGVAAIRLTPVGGDEVIHGRKGLLAHTFMLGPRGDSNGCISFRDYNAFLQAFKRGDVKKIVVVGSMT